MNRELRCQVSSVKPCETQTCNSVVAQTKPEGHCWKCFFSQRDVLRVLVSPLAASHRELQGDWIFLSKILIFIQHAKESQREEYVPVSYPGRSCWFVSIEHLKSITLSVYLHFCHILWATARVLTLYLDTDQSGWLQERSAWWSARGPNLPVLKAVANATPTLQANQTAHTCFSIETDSMFLTKTFYMKLGWHVLSLLNLHQFVSIYICHHPCGGCRSVPLRFFLCDACRNFDQLERSL